MKTWIEIGTSLIDEGKSGNLHLNIAKLIDTRALITGNSGAGKSRLLRRLAEQAFGNVQVIVLDPEGEFSTLREKHGFLLAGRGGEVLAEPRAAALLARRLVELRVSAVLDIYELRLQERRSFVRLFLESLIDLPKSLYAPVLVLLDEAHLFAPEGKDEAESRNAVIDLMTRGRKRGICGVLASQRLSKLDKDAAAEAKNIFIGGITLDVDQKRAADALGLASKEERLALRDVPAGEFLAYGPALDIRGVVRFTSGATFTTHPKAGERHKLAPTPTPDAISKVVHELKDLPQKADEELKTLRQAQARVKELERALKAQPKPAPAPPAQKTREVQVLKDRDTRRLESRVVTLNATSCRLEEASKRTQAAVAAVAAQVEAITTAMKAARREGEPRTGVMSMEEIERAYPAKQVTTRRLTLAGDVEQASVPAHVKSATAAAHRNGNLGKCERAILAVLAQHPDGCKVGKITLLARYRMSGGFKNALSTLRQGGLMTGANNETLEITDAGKEALGPFQPLPSGHRLQTYWLEHRSFGQCERAILGHLIGAHPEYVSMEELAINTNYKVSGGFKNSLSNLRTSGVIVGKNAEGVRASDTLFD